MNIYRWSGFDTPYFRDLLEDAPTFRLLHTAAFFDSANPLPVAYPPFGAVQLALLYSSGHPVIFFLLLAVAGLSLALWGVRRALIASWYRPADRDVFSHNACADLFPDRTARGSREY